MEIKTLAHISIADITSAFNEAFRGYFIPLEFTDQAMAAKIKSEGIQLDCSVGAFQNGKLVAFILHGLDVINGVPTIYNAGTGVLPAFRGKGLTKSLYQYAIPLLGKQGFHHHVLEVIEQNVPAIKIYEHIGFHKVRKLNAYKGSIAAKTVTDCDVKEVESVPKTMQSLFEMTPAWQNSVTSIDRDWKNHQIVGGFIGDELVAIGAFVASTGRVKLCFVLTEHRRKGIGTALLSFMQQNASANQLVLTNVDDSYRPANEFLKALNLENFLSLYEMKMEVDWSKQHPKL